MTRSSTATQEQPDQFGRGNDLANLLTGRHQVVEIALAQRRRVTDDDDQPSRPRHGHVQALLESQESDITPTIGAHQGQHDDVFLAALERVDRVDLELSLGWPVVRTHQATQQVALLGVGGDHADGQVRRRLTGEIARDAGHQARLGDVEQRCAASTRLNIAAQGSRVDPRDRRRKGRQTSAASRRGRASAHLIGVEDARDELADGRVHAVLLVEQHCRRRCEAALLNPGKQALANHVVRTWLGHADQSGTVSAAPASTIVAVRRGDHLLFSLGHDGLQLHRIADEDHALAAGERQQ